MTYYVLDGQNVAMEWCDADFDGHLDTGEATTYCLGPRGVHFRIDGSGNRRWNVCDSLGSVLAEINNDGDITASRKYDVYGALRCPGGCEGAGSQKFCGSLGHTQEAATGPTNQGLIYMRARWYDPVAGRFISEDPVRNGADWYAYCNGNPVGRVDRTGRWSWQVDAALLVFSWFCATPYLDLVVAAVGTLACAATAPLGAIGVLVGQEAAAGPAVFSALLAEAGFNGGMASFTASFTVEREVIHGILTVSGYGALALNALGAIAEALVVYDIMNRALGNTE